MFSHEAHHRGQVILLAHQLGYRLTSKAWGGIWQWEKRWKDARAGHTPALVGSGRTTFGRSFRFAR